MNNTRLPATDSVTYKGLMTALQALIAFLVGLVITVFNVPGVPQAIISFTVNHLPDVLFSVGVPIIVGSGATSFIINYLFRKNIPTY